MSTAQQKTTGDACHSTEDEQFSSRAGDDDTTVTRDGDQAMQDHGAKSKRESTMIPLQGKQEAAPEETRGNYGTVRFNAMKHGILSNLTVLAHENRAEFDDLLAALFEEHQPSGMTEQHLVEELAAIIWRKRRILLAEGAAINRGLHSVVHGQYDSPLPSAAPFESGLTREGVDLPDLLTAGRDEIEERRHQAGLDLAATRKAASILRKAGSRAYERARRALIQESRDWWDEHVAEEEYPATAEGLEQ
mgnify:CR=1 FL=1